MKINQDKKTGDLEVYFTRNEFKAIRKHKKLTLSAVQARHASNNIMKVVMELNKYFPEDVQKLQTTSEDC